ncbi:hypothetical protein VTO42DRAFT_552 [Malbranchea cinnamomea]
MRLPSPSLPAVGSHFWIFSLSLLSLTFLVACAHASLFDFTPAPLPDLDLEPLGRIALTGNFDAISLYSYEQQRDGSAAAFNRSQAQSLIAQLPNGALTPISSADADILALCYLPTGGDDDSNSVIVVGGNFTSLGGVESPALALFNPDSGKVTEVSSLSGQVLALFCDLESRTVYVGGDFKSSNSSNAIIWSPDSGLSNLPFGGFNGPVRSIVKTQDGRIIFGGSFDGLGNTTSPSLRDQQTINLETAEITSSTSSSTPGFGDPRNVICKSDGQDGPDKTWLLADNAPGFWRADMRFGFRPTKLRLWNTHLDGRGTKTFRFTALPDNGILNLTYTDPNSGDIVACDARCPLSDDPAETFRDFHFVNIVGMSGFMIDISEWYGPGGGLAGIQLFEDDIYAYAVSDFNEPACANIPFRSQSTTTGNWQVTQREGSYDYLSTRIDSSTDQVPSVIFEPNIQQTGNYSVTVFTPGCVEDGTCATRGIVNITATLSSQDAEPIQAIIHQTNNFEKYDQIYLGHVDASREGFRPTVTLTPIAGQIGDIEVVAARVRFELISSTGGLNGLFEFDPSEEEIDSDFSKSAVNRAGTELERGASITSLRWNDGVLYVGGKFSDAPVENIVSLDGGRVASLPGDGLNSEVKTMLLMDDMLYIGGNFTNTAKQDNDALQHVAAYSISDKSWITLGSGVNGPVYSLVRFPVNVSEDTTEMAIAVSGRFTRINAFDDFPSTPANGFAIWLPSQNNWLEHTSINQMAYVGQLTASVGLGNDTVLAGSLASGGIASHGAVSLSNEDGLVLRSLPVDIQLSQSELPARKRASESEQTSAVITGVFDRDSNRNLTILAGHFSAKASDGSTIENMLFLNGTDGDTVSGPGPGIDSESVIRNMAVQGTLLFAGGAITGSISGSEVNGVVVYDLSRRQYHETQPGALAGDSVVVHTIAPRPGSYDVYIGGQFLSAASLPCPGVCIFQTEGFQWRRPGSTLQGTVSVLTWISDDRLIAAGNLTVSGNRTALASYNAEEQTWSVISGPSSSVITGPVTALGLAREDGSRFWVTGKSSDGLPFLVFYDGTDFRSVDSLFGEQTTIEGVQVLAVKEEHEDSEYLNKDQVLLVTGRIQLPEFGLVSAALYNGTTMSPFILSSTADGRPGTIIALLSEYENKFSSGPRGLSRGLIVLISFCLALACIFLIVLVGIILARIRRYRQGYVRAPQGTDRRPDLKRVPPEYLLDSLRHRPNGAPAL